MEPAPFKIAIATGGSGGHVIPSEELAVRLTQLGCQVTLLGHHVTQNPFFTLQDLKKMDIPSSALGLKTLPAFMLKNTLGLMKALKFFIKSRPDVVVGFGSFHSFPVLLAAFFLNIPIALYEANTTLGKVIKLFSKRAKVLASPFDRYSAYKNFIQVEPLIKKVEALQVFSQIEALAYFDLKENKKTVLICGGSQGAQFLNKKLLAQLLPTLDKETWQVIHLAGKKADVAEIRQHYQQMGIEVCVKGYEEKMSLAYLAADVIITRSGATTLFEIAQVKKPALLIPFPHSKDQHQLMNAQHFVKAHAGLVLEEKLCKDVHLKGILESLLTDAKACGNNSQLPAKIDFDKKVLELCLKR